MYVDSNCVVNDTLRNTYYNYLSNMGVKQGDGASPELFLLFIDRVYPYLLEYYAARNIGEAKRNAYTIASL
jgi:hypothetical protein